MNTNQVKPAVCPACGQRSDRRPGFRWYPVGAEAIFVGEELAMLNPHYLECRTCGHKEMLPGTAIEVRKP